jgi:hypothetical protein
MTNTTSTNKTKTETQPFSAEQRKGIAQLLADAKKRAQKGFESDDDLDDRIAAEFLPKLAKERGATSQVEKVRRFYKEHEEAEETLGKLGFVWNEYAKSLALHDDAPKELSLALKKARDSARKERDAQLLKYDKAILKVWAAEDADEMMAIVEELL